MEYPMGYPMEHPTGYSIGYPMGDPMYDPMSNSVGHGRGLISHHQTVLPASPTIASISSLPSLLTPFSFR